MAEYKGIHGIKIQNVSSDPPASFVGQVWYNSSAQVLKTNLGTPVGAWATSGNLNTGRKKWDQLANEHQFWWRT